MDIHNLATVMTPNILYSNNKTGVDDSFLAIEAVTLLIEFNDTMCEVSNWMSTFGGKLGVERNPADIGYRSPKISNRS